MAQPSKPRVLIYNREIGEELESELEPDWNLIASCSVGEHSFLALVTLGGKLSTLSIQLRFVNIIIERFVFMHFFIILD